MKVPKSRVALAESVKAKLADSTRKVS